jgi:hypothetical protein
MDEKELLEKITGQVKSIITEQNKESVSKADVDAKLEAVNKEIEQLSDASTRKMAELLADMSAKYQEAFDMAKEAKVAANEVRTAKAQVAKTAEERIMDAFMEKKSILLTEKNDDYGQRLSLKEYFTKSGNQHSPTLVVKEAVEMLGANIIGANIGTIRLAETVGVVQLPLSIYPNVFGYMPTRRLSRPTMSFTVYYDFVSGTATKPEGTASAKSSLKLKTVEIKAVSIATHVVLSEETMDDLPEVIQELTRVLPVDIKEKIQTAIFGATGDDLTTLAGILTANKHTAFSAATYQNTVTGANIIDVIAKMKLQAEGNKYRPNVVLLNPLDIDNFSALKDALTNSVKDNRVVFGANGVPTYVCGMLIIASSDIEADTAIVLDINKTLLGIRKDMTIEIGRNGTDLT